MQISWIKKEEAKLKCYDKILFIEHNDPWMGWSAFGTIHKGWLTENEGFYSEGLRNYIDTKKVTYVMRIPPIPNPSRPIYSGDGCCWERIKEINLNLEDMASSDIKGNIKHLK